MCVDLLRKITGPEGTNSRGAALGSQRRRSRQEDSVSGELNKEWPLWFAACPRIGQLRGLSNARWWTALTVKIDSTVGASWRLTMADLGSERFTSTDGVMSVASMHEFGT